MTLFKKSAYETIFDILLSFIAQLEIWLLLTSCELVSNVFDGYSCRKKVQKRGLSNKEKENNQTLLLLKNSITFIVSLLFSFFTCPQINQN